MASNPHKRPEGYAEITWGNRACQAIENKGVKLVEAGGVEVLHRVESTQVIENRKRQKR
jgi:hypothetical protein